MQLIKTLDLTDFLEELKGFYAREKSFVIDGDIIFHYQFIQELARHKFNSPPKIKNLDSQLQHLKKYGILSLDAIFEFVKIIRYFLYLKKIGFEKTTIIKEWLGKILFPETILEIQNYFDEKGELKKETDPLLAELEKKSKKIEKEIQQKIKSLINTRKLIGYLADNQMHFVNEKECLLLKSGFNHVLKGKVIARSSFGYFYVFPEAIEKLRKTKEHIFEKIEEIHYQWSKKISMMLWKHTKFLEFLDKKFDKFDHYQARVNFAKSKELLFVLPKNSKKIILKNFIHPALSNPKPINVSFEKEILVITGVNAGGKTVLLKSILSAVFLAKHLIPMKIEPLKSHIGKFKEILSIIEDPQNVKNDISTFAGRMIEFGKLFQKKDILVGVDEIELGTDAEESAALFKVILEKLMEKNIKIAITTHHKRLALLLSSNEKVELTAAIYDEAKGLPTYEFLHGIIGKSYAFETARRYGISKEIVNKAVIEYGKEMAKLNELIEKGSLLENISTNCRCNKTKRSRTER